jgi:hypothetical protein
VNVHVNTHAAPPSPPRGASDERDAENTSALQPFHLSRVQHELEAYQRIHAHGMEGDLQAFAQSTLRMYARVNESYSRCAEARARSAELDVEHQQKKQRAEHAHELRVQRLEELKQGAALLNNQSAMTQSARHALGRHVVSLYGEPMEFGAIADGDPATLLQLNAVPRALQLNALPPRLTAAEHLGRLLGAPLTDKAMARRLAKDAHAAMVALVGADALRPRGTATTLRFTEAELEGLKPVFDRYVAAARVADA